MSNKEELFDVITCWGEVSLSCSEETSEAMLSPLTPEALLPSCCPAPSSCLSCRWSTLGWPHKISEQVEYCSEQLNQDEERFQKNMLADQAAYEDRLDTLVGVACWRGGCGSYCRRLVKVKTVCIFDL